MQKEAKIYLEIEKSKIQREKAKLVLDKSITLYIVFMFIGVFGIYYKFIDSTALNVMIIIGIIILLAGTTPYMIIVHKEEKKIENLLK